MADLDDVISQRIADALDPLIERLTQLEAKQAAGGYDAEAMTVVSEFTQEVGSRTGDQRAAFIAAAQAFMEGYSDPSA